MKLHIQTDVETYDSSNADPSGTNHSRLEKESESEEELGLRSDEGEKSPAIGNAQMHESKRTHR